MHPWTGIQTEVHIGWDDRLTIVEPSTASSVLFLGILWECPWSIANSTILLQNKIKNSFEILLIMSQIKNLSTTISNRDKLFILGHFYPRVTFYFEVTWEVHAHVDIIRCDAFIHCRLMKVQKLLS